MVSSFVSGTAGTPTCLLAGSHSVMTLVLITKNVIFAQGHGLFFVYLKEYLEKKKEVHN